MCVYYKCECVCNMSVCVCVCVCVCTVNISCDKFCVKSFRMNDPR